MNATTAIPAAAAEPASAYNNSAPPVSKQRYYVHQTQELRFALHDSVPPDPLLKLHQKSAARHFLVYAWQLFLTIASTVVLINFDQPWIWIPVAFVQGFTVFNYTVLLHEVVHSGVFKHQRPGWMRFLGLLYAIPSGISATQFTRWHLDHHNELGSATDDPKRFHLSPKRQERWYKLLYFTPALFPIYFRAAKRETATYPQELRDRIRWERMAAMAFHLSIAIGLLVIDWRMAMRVHIVPVFFIFPIAFAMNRLGQHYFINPKDPAQWSTLVKANPFWRVAFLNSSYHLEHHYYPGIPLYNLHQSHLLLREFYKKRGMQAVGYSQLLWGWIVKNGKPHTNWREQQN
ncbi:MAG: fatty acid desaturase family protein [Planctomycetota bacterium]